MRTRRGDLGQEHGGGDGSVQRIDMPNHRDFGDEIAVPDKESGDPEPFASNHEGNRAFVVDFVVIRRSGTVARDNPKTIVLQFADGLGQVGDRGDFLIADGAGGNLGNGAIEGDFIPLLHDDAIDSKRIAGAENRPEVMRIFNAI